MKRHLLTFLFMLCVITFTQAQFTQTQGFNYKALITNNGNALSNQSVTIRFNILENGTTSVYRETHTVTTDANGIAKAAIGEGNPMNGSFTNIDWAGNIYFLKVEINTGSGYQDFGTSELKAVPFAKFANRVGIADNINGIPVSTTTPNNGQVLKYNGSSFVPADDDISGGSGTDGVVNSAAFSGTTTKTLTLARSNGLGNLTATFTDNVNDADHSTTNEIQHISKSGNIVSLSNCGGSFTDAVNDADHDATNELQTLTKTGNVVGLSNGGGDFIDEVNDADHDPNNEIQSLSINGSQLSISGGNTVSLPTGGGSGVTKIDDLSDAKSDSDGSNDGSSVFLGNLPDKMMIVLITEMPVWASML